MNNDLIFARRKSILSYYGSMQILFAEKEIPLLRILLHKTI